MNRTNAHVKACNHLKSVDPAMRAIITKIGKVELKARRLEPHHALIRSVINQQLSVKAGATILNRFKMLFPNSEFPSPQELLQADVEKLRSAGLSKAKTGYVKNIAQHVTTGLIPSLAECAKLSDSDIIDRLTQIKGIGRWTAEMFLMFNLGRPDVLPVHDLILRKGFQLAFRKRKLPKPEQLDEYGQRWSPYRSTAALYLWRYAD